MVALRAVLQAKVILASYIFPTGMFRAVERKRKLAGNIWVKQFYCNSYHPPVHIYYRLYSIVGYRSNCLTDNVHTLSVFLLGVFLEYKELCCCHPNYLDIF